MDLKKPLENKLEEIADFLLTHKDDNREIGALAGISGNALFHFYYADYKDNESHREKGAALLSEVFNRIEKGYTYPTFCDGIAGALWVLELLKEEQFIALEEDIITVEVDEYLYDKMKHFIAANNFDFLHGAIGIGYYFLKRYQNIQSPKLNSRYEKHLLQLLDAIAQSAIQEKNILRWKSEIRSGDVIANGCNLGLAHGIPSIILFLCKLAPYPIFSDKTRNLLKPAANFILMCKHTDTTISSSFPNWILEHQANSSRSRLAWCYGDLGVGIALLKTAEILKDKTLYKEAIDILTKTTKRQDVTEAGIKDLGLCHGSYGVMRMYQQIYKMSDHKIFKEATDFWAILDLDSIDTNQEITNSILEKKYLLDGASGIGLAILSYLDDSKKALWEEVLLIK